MSGLNPDFDSRPLVLTAQLAKAEQEYFQALRDRHFPSTRNLVPAHITMFHALPPDAREDIEATIVSVLAQTAAFLVSVEEPFSLGSGVAFRIKATELASAHQEIAKAFSNKLTRQDSQAFRPHITIQNKVASDVARDTLSTLRVNFQPFHTTIASLKLWEYKGGPWQLLRVFDVFNRCNQTE